MKNIYIAIHYTTMQSKNIINSPVGSIDRQADKNTEHKNQSN